MNNNKISVPPMISTTIVVVVFMFGSYAIKYGSIAVSSDNYVTIAIIHDGTKEHPFKEDVLRKQRS